MKFRKSISMNSYLIVPAGGASSWCSIISMECYSKRIRWQYQKCSIMKLSTHYCILCQRQTFTQHLKGISLCTCGLCGAVLVVLCGAATSHFLQHALAPLLPQRTASWTALASRQDSSQSFHLASQTRSSPFIWHLRLGVEYASVLAALQLCINVLPPLLLDGMTL